MRRLLLAASAALAAVALAPVAPASAQGLAWSSCDEPAGFDCATLTVPLDRSGTVAGTARIAAVRRVTGTSRAREAVVALAGGPGQAAVPFAGEFARELAPAVAAGRDVLVFDQRGTGGSTPLRCSALGAAGGSVSSAVSRCAGQLGATRGTFRTVDSADDLEALRVAAGYEQLVLYGVSYGTKVAQVYAARYPQRVSALVLDSTVALDGPDPLQRSTLQAVPRVLRALCAGDACRRSTTDPVGTLRRLAAQVRRRELSGPFTTGSGRSLRGTVDEDDLVDVLVAGDLSPILRQELPGAMVAARRGDVRPMIRLVGRSLGFGRAGFQATTGEDATSALYLATLCEEAALPWPRAASSATARAAGLAAATDALPAGSTGPFSRDAARGGFGRLCLGWPPASPAPAALGALPAVPTLLIAGAADLRTPLEDAQRVRGQLSGAQLTTAPNAGHSVLGNDACTDSALAAFFGAAAPSCTPEANPYPPVRTPPATLGAVRTYGATGTAGRTAAAVFLTVEDARRQILAAAQSRGALPGAVGGLRSGSVRVGDDTFTLRSASFVPGVTVSGRVTFRGRGTVTVRGAKAARGTLTIDTRTLAVRGTLGGRRVSASGARAAGNGEHPLGPVLAPYTRGDLERAAAHARLHGAG